MPVEAIPTPETISQVMAELGRRSAKTRSPEDMRKLAKLPRPGARKPRKSSKPIQPLSLIPSRNQNAP